MSTPLTVEAALVEWGERLFYPANRIVRSSKTPRPTALSFAQRAAAVRARLEATVLRQAPQVMVKEVEREPRGSLRSLKERKLATFWLR